MDKLVFILIIQLCIQHCLNAIISYPKTIDNSATISNTTWKIPENDDGMINFDLSSSITARDDTTLPQAERIVTPNEIKMPQENIIGNIELQNISKTQGENSEEIILQNQPKINTEYNNTIKLQGIKSQPVLENVTSGVHHEINKSQTKTQTNRDEIESNENIKSEVVTEATVQDNIYANEENNENSKKSEEIKFENVSNIKNDTIMNFEHIKYQEQSATTDKPNVIIYKKQAKNGANVDVINIIDSKKPTVLNGTEHEEIAKLNTGLNDEGVSNLNKSKVSSKEQDGGSLGGSSTFTESSTFPDEAYNKFTTASAESIMFTDLSNMRDDNLNSIMENFTKSTDNKDELNNFDESLERTTILVELLAGNTNINAEKSEQEDLYITEKIYEKSHENITGNAVELFETSYVSSGSNETSDAFSRIIETSSVLSEALEINGAVTEAFKTNSEILEIIEEISILSTDFENTSYSSEDSITITESDDIITTSVGMEEDDAQTSQGVQELTSAAELIETHVLFIALLLVLNI